MRKLSFILPIFICIVLLVSCGGQKPIVVDTTGMSDEQIKGLEWKVRYAVALDWYDYSLKSYKDNLDAMPRDKADAVHVKAWPVFKKIGTALTAMSIAVTGWSVDPEDAAANYELYRKAKMELLAILAE